MVHSKDCLFITPRGGPAALVAEMKELGIACQEHGTDTCRAMVTETQLGLIRKRSQCASRVMHFLGSANDREALAKLAQELPKPTGTFSVRTNSADSQELQEEIGAIIHDTTGAPVNLSKPDTPYFVHDCDGLYLLGIDLFGDLAKRHYKIITGAQSLAGPVAAVTLRLSGWTPKKGDLLVWPCTTGELAIEAGLWAAQKSPRAYELQDFSEKESPCAIIAADPKLPMVTSSQKNAKIAGVHTIIKFSRQDADWLDTKHDEHGIDHLVGLLPNLKIMPKLVPEIFYQLEFILAKDGVAAFLCVNDDSASMLEEEGLKQKEYAMQRTYVWGGKHAFTLVLLTRQAKKKKISSKSAGGKDADVKKTSSPASED